MKLRIPAPGLRTQVLLLALVLLAIPWVGYRYILEMERFLRESQERSLSATARAVATALYDRRSLFSSGGAGPLGGTDTGLYVRALPSRIHIDGFGGDWPALTDASAEQRMVFSGATVSVAPRFGKRERYLYLVAEVADEKLVYRASASQRLDAGDLVDLGLVDPRGRFERYVLSPTGPGALHGWRVAGGKATWQQPVAEPRIEAFWRETQSGYTVEVRMPVTMIGPRLGMAVASVDDADRREITSKAGPTGTDTPGLLAPVVIPESEIDLVLQELGRTSSRIWIVDRDHRVLAQTGTLKPALEQPAAPANPSGSYAARAWSAVERATLRRIYARVLPRPRDDFDEGPGDPSRLIGAQIEQALSGTSSTEWRTTPDKRAVILSATHPIRVADRIAGAVVVEETTNAILSVRTRALETLFTTALIVLALGSLALFFFATRLSTRISRLRDEAERAVDAQGKVRGGIATSEAADEIGDLSRSFATIVRRLGEYNDYLQNMAGSLAHEIRTPIAVVRSSLDNLGLQPLPADAKRYMERAREGLARLTRILGSMTEATRLEQLLQHAEREPFDVLPVVTGCVAGYRMAYPARSFVLEAPEAPVKIYGAPDFVAQMLDKLAANAVEFAVPGSSVLITLSIEDERAYLRVSNEGPLLPSHMEGRLFDSMVSIRPNAASAEPHLGMGLYIVRMIAQFHDGEVAAANRDDGKGVIVTVQLPLCADR